MRERLYQFMQERYGIDQFSKFLVVLGLILSLLSSFLSQDFLYIMGLMIFVYGYYRVFSKNHVTRYKENQRYLYYVSYLKSIIKKEKKMANYRKTHHVYTCPSCKQKIKIPRGKGKVEISCPKCYTKFIKRS